MRAQRALVRSWLALMSTALCIVLAEANTAHADGPISFILSGGRGRVLQFCVGAMCLGLFILMRRWTEVGPGSRGRGPDGPDDTSSC